MSDKECLLRLMDYARTYFRKRDLDRSTVFIKHFANENGIDLGMNKPAKPTRKPNRYKRPGLSGRVDAVWGNRRCPTMTRQEWERRLSLVPKDTRDLTAKLMGDPIPGDARWSMFPGTETQNGNSTKWATRR